MTDHTALKALAEAATEGPWVVADFADDRVGKPPHAATDIFVSCDWPAPISVAYMGGGFDGAFGLEQARKDAAYIAAASPDKLLSLLAEHEAKDRRVAELEKELLYAEEWGKWNDDKDTG